MLQPCSRLCSLHASPFALSFQFLSSYVYPTPCISHLQNEVFKTSRPFYLTGLFWASSQILMRVPCKLLITIETSLSLIIPIMNDCDTTYLLRTCISSRSHTHVTTAVLVFSVWALLSPVLTRVAEQCPARSGHSLGVCWVHGVSPSIRPSTIWGQSLFFLALTPQCPTLVNSPDLGEASWEWWHFIWDWMNMQDFHRWVREGWAGQVEK